MGRRPARVGELTIDATTPPREVTSRGGAPARSSADLVAGLAFVAIGVAFGATALGYDLGIALSMGPAMFPLIVCGLLVAVGVAIVVRAFVRPSQEPVESRSPEDQVEVVAIAMEEGVDAAVDAPTQPQRFGRVPWRPLALISVAVVWFALTIDGLGLLLACFGTVVLASLARPGVRWWQPLVVAAGLTAMSWLIFVVGLRLRVPLLGDWLGG